MRIKAPLPRLLKTLLDAPARRSRGYMLPQQEPSGRTSGNRYLVTASIFRNEAPTLREFVMFHQLVGVDHMLLYDDGSTDRSREALAEFVRKGFVTYIPWPRFAAGRNNQFLAYQHAAALCRGTARWLAMIDCDEFLFAPQSNDLKAELRQREQHAAIGVFSRTFGTSGVTQLAKGALVTRTFTQSAPGDYVFNRTHRTIADPERIAAIRSANSCVLAGTDVLSWDEDGRPIYATGEAGHGRDKLRINHYFTKSKADFEAKIARSYFGKGGWDRKMDAKRQEMRELDEVGVQDLTIIEAGLVDALEKKMTARGEQLERA